MKILNCYAGIGGNRALWGVEHQITSVEFDHDIAAAYAKMYPQDTLVIGDAHQYILDHHQEYDFIWSSPPCPSHSRANMSLQGYGIYRYPDMRLYEEIIFLSHFFKGKWVVENVIPYYDPLIKPTVELDRHFFWSNFPITNLDVVRNYNVARAKKEEIADHLGIHLPNGTHDQRKLLRNAVYPPIGAHILTASQKTTIPMVY